MAFISAQRRPKTNLKFYGPSTLISPARRVIISRVVWAHRADDSGWTDSKGKGSTGRNGIVGELRATSASQASKSKGAKYSANGAERPTAPASLPCHRRPRPLRRSGWAQHLPSLPVQYHTSSTSPTGMVGPELAMSIIIIIII